MSGEKEFCNCDEPEDVFNGVCGKCLLPEDDSSRKESGELI